MSRSGDDAALARVVAGELMAARADGGLVEPPSRRHPGFTLDDAYRVAALVRRRRVDAGAVMAGAKLGLTDPSLWELLGVDGPFWAPLYDDTVSASGEVWLGEFVAPRLEPEILVGLGRPLAPGAGPDEVRRALAWAALSFEVVQCRYPGWSFSGPDALADDGLHARLVVGDPTELRPGDADALARTAVVLERSGTQVATGVATAALGGPVHAVEWLLRLPGVGELPAGTVVTTGTLTVPEALAPGEQWRSEAAGPVALSPLTLATT